MIIENLQPNNLLIPYKFHVAFYYIAVTLTTVGYGDFYPYTDEGRMFIFVLLLYAIVIKIPRLMNDLLRLMSLKSVYERRVYNTNVEIPHVIITGQVTLQSLQNVCIELFHPDHGRIQRHAIVL